MQPLVAPPIPVKRQPLRKTMSLEDSVALMGEGHKHALKLLRMIAATNHMLILHLDDMNLRGVQVWCAFYYFCDGIFEKFSVMVLNRDAQMVAFVNTAFPMMKAVTRGGAPRD
jgi:hypothetical protein